MIRNNIAQNGYFHAESKSGDIDNLIFYPDGTFCYNVNIIDDEKCESRDFHIFNYGVYEMNQDTIRANYYEDYSYMHWWYLKKLKYVILDSVHIKCISKEDIGTGKKNTGFLNFPNKIYTLIPCDSLPAPESPWKKYEWLWNEDPEKD